MKMTKPKITDLTTLLTDVKVHEATNGFSYLGKDADGTIFERDSLVNSLKIQTKASQTTENYKKIYAQRICNLDYELPTIQFNKDHVIATYPLEWTPGEVLKLYNRLNKVKDTYEGY